MSRLLLFVLLLVSATGDPLVAQASGDPDGVDVGAVLGEPRVAQAVGTLRESRAAAADLLVRLGSIVSPSGEELERAQAVAEHMRAIGLDSVRVTQSPNAVGVIPGSKNRALVFVSTLDDLATVAEHQRNAAAPPRVEGDRVVGPGTNTSLTTAAMLTAAESYLSSGLEPEHDLVFAAVAQEETGLRGMRALVDAYGDRALAFVDVLGDGHTISYGALGIHWWQVFAEGPAGHTLGGGLPNVNQAIARAVDAILSLPAAARTGERRTRLNVAMIQSGSVFNHKPESGWFSLDIRSMEAEIIDAIEADIRRILEGVEAETGITLRMEPFQRTPGGRIPGARRSRLVRAAEAVARHLGYAPTLSESGSSNMNVAVAADIPAIGLGGSRGGERGRPGEWADIGALMRTAEHVLLLAAILG